MLIFNVAHIHYVFPKLCPFINILFKFKIVHEEVTHVTAVVWDLVEIKEVLHRSNKIRFKVKLIMLHVFPKE